MERPPRERFATRSLAFDVDGETARGTLYLPPGTDDPPTIVMAPGLAAERVFGYPAVAERFADAGYAAFSFDHRGFGDSDGDDQTVSPARHREDQAAALDRLSRVDALGSKRVLWGTSLSGGTAISLAVERRDVDAVIGVAPLLDGRQLGRSRGGRYVAGGVLTGVRDRLGRRIGRGGSVPVVGGTEEFALLTEPGTQRGYLDLVDRESRWRNETPARSLLGLLGHRPIERVEEVTVPTLLLAGTDDPVAPAERVAEAAERLDRGTFVSMPMDHFSAFGADFEPAVGHQLSFLRDVFDRE
ncbi:Lysophospholipase, alpha-beta hydrolase superfamily [Halorubrum vacuolatum]|uniref:Lysophospholipase, alpha-beta hydrolase superfamily n=1 Tax=Halorubrum vacuolatum TaxID=63740 RepID=A0A238WUL3_HALVU|nr:Lysophospholipase, alpha-beta hydrolase superfamily [Halorubrum vacuolatum]